MNIKNILKILAVALMAAAVTACSSSRKAGADSSATPKPGKVAPMRVNDVKSLADTYSAWTSFYAPFSMRLAQPVSFNFSGRATMERDKSIFLSMRVLGMEMASLYANNDSVFLADKFHRYLVAVPFKSLSGRTQLTLGDLQSLLLGQAFFPGRGRLDALNDAQSLFSPAHNGNETILTPRRLPEGATWYFTMDNTPALTKIVVEPDGADAFTMVFTDFVETVAGRAASMVGVDGKFKNKRLEAAIEWNMDKARWDDGRKASKPSYDGYRRLSLADLLTAMKSM